MPEETSAVQAFYDQVTNVSDFIWGGTWNGVSVLPFPPMVIALLGVGLWMMIGLRFYPILNLGPAFVGLFKSEKTADAEGDGKKGEISPFAALSTALSGQVGTGNLAGVATAITLGGPGALFWMWITALIGMALAFAEGSLAIRFREQGPDGEYRGGPMTYIRRGLGKKWGWLAVLFCVGTLFSSVTTGNMIQANSVADSINGLTGMPEWVAGLIVAAAVFAVIIGGIKSIGAIAEKIVPTMALAYITMAIVALIMNFEDLPGAFATIFESAFTGHAAAGGFVGAGMIVAIRAGVARGLFSNEAGQGSTAIAHAVAQTDDPARQGRFAMMGTFIDTIIICTATGLVLLTVQGAFPATGADGVTVMQEHAWSSDLNGFAMTEAAYAAAFPLQVFGFSIGALIASLALILFVFTTLITWSYYGERATTHLFGQKMAIPFRLVWVVMIFIGSFQEITFVWRMGDIANASMALPNLVALALLSGVVFKLARGDKKAGADHD
ncbi:sodium:alanine symporter family protein [Phenylobacterium sp.]|mgnify:FL=1|jgi:AGCS family alanine or glycine:cation symporter|uniref:alanine/glycine:cation symporter family protein n=1 Tax=Phenylobacterium sp. TaxID=1871053 RepID=UPI000C8D6B6A|nr:sodium:alanine symporter family protein [Phenylobacterium sp.]MAK83124.1 sodium:alanine symporter family protein [Phenylobacterium sp.]|tara:strand:- start:3577 stop:5067 length:1491 start_codon:yes stop_codon:yes gene_type:complete